MEVIEKWLGKENIFDYSVPPMYSYLALNIVHDTSVQGRVTSGRIYWCTGMQLNLFFMEEMKDGAWSGESCCSWGLFLKTLFTFCVQSFSVGGDGVSCSRIHCIEQDSKNGSVICY